MTHHASCLCGAIRFTTTHDLGSVTACHCSQCRRQTGHFAVATPVPWDSIEMTGTPAWYASSATGRRGFCGTCGSYLIWEEGDGLAYVMAGAFDGDPGVAMDAHIFHADAGDYYDVGTALPRYIAQRSGSKVPA